MVILYGKPAGNELLEHSGGPLAPETTYQLEITVNQKVNAEQIQQFVYELQRKYNIKVTYVRANKKNITIQFVTPNYVPLQGGILTGALLISSLPAILSLVGLGLVIVSLFFVVTSMPLWVVILFIIGIALLFISPFSREFITGTTKTVVQRTVG